MDDKRSYLEQLQYEDKLGHSFIAKYLTNFRYVLLLILAIVVAGIFSFVSLPRRLNPQIKIPIVSVATILPGAAPEDLESLVTTPVEDQIASLDGINQITSTSVDNVSIVSAEFKSGIDPDRAKDKVQSAVDSITTLPKEAQTPKVQKLDFENQPVWQFLVTTDGDEASLLRFGANLKDRLEKLPSVKSVAITGTEEEEIQVLINPNVQRDYNINPLVLSQAIQASIHSQPAGNINTTTSSFVLTIDPQTSSVEELRDLHLSVAGQVIRLGDVATVAVHSKPNQPKAFYADNQTLPKRAITFSIFKTDTTNIDIAVKNTQTETDKALAQNPGKFKLLTIINLAHEIDKQFFDLLGSFRDTIILVVLVLLIFLGIRQALIVAFSIPLAFLIAFTVMNVTGLTINFLSLFSLILALGLLVDDAIVVVTAATAYWRSRKFTPNQTGLLVLRDFIVPIWSTTITAVWAFLPLLVASGIIGEFIKSISVVVSTTLIASTAIAVLVTLPMMMVFLKPNFPNRVRLLLWFLAFLGLFAIVIILSLNSPLLPINLLVVILLALVAFTLRSQLAKETTLWIDKVVDSQKLKTRIGKVLDTGIVDSTKLSGRYQRLIDRVLTSSSARNKTLIIVVLFALFSYLLVPLGFVTNEFFPKTEQDTVYVTVELPAGTNLDTSSKEAENLLDQLRTTKGVSYVTAEAAKSISTGNFFGPTQAANNILFTLVLPDKKDRKVSSFDISADLRNRFDKYYRGTFSVVEVSGGPPAGADIQIKLLGDDTKVLNTYADKLVAFLDSQEGVTNAQKSIKAGSGKIVFVPDKVKLAQLGLTQADLGSQLRAYASGFTLFTDSKIDGTKKDITFRTNSTLQSPETLSSLNIQTQSGILPLSALGSFQFKSTSTQITREDRKRTLSVTAAIEKGQNVQTVNKKLEDYAKNSLNLPAGYEWKTGGVNEENQKSVNSIFQAMIIAFILIATTMVVQFGSYRKAFIILLLIPLAISGVFVVFALTATPLSFPTLIGILALFGIVVYQSMLIVDKIGRNQRAGMHLQHAISDAAASRVEPIMFGTITTVIGLIPITLTNPLWRGLGGAIIAGMLFSGAIMLFFVPVVYFKIFEKEV